jgi:hypothetical protein
MVLEDIAIGEHKKIILVEQVYISQLLTIPTQERTGENTELSAFKIKF